MAVIATGAPLWMGTAEAATETWQGTTANMNTAANWSGTAVPTSGDLMLFNGSSAQNSPTLNATIGGAGLGSGAVVGIQLASGQAALQVTNNGTAGIVGLRLPAAVATAIQIDAGAGALTLGDGAGTGATFSIATNGSGTLSFLNNSTNAATFTSDVTLVPGGAGATVGWIFGGTGDWAVNGNISTGTGTASVTKSGAGTLTLGAANTYAGDTVINGGTLALTNSLALQASPLNYNNQGGTLSFGSLTAATVGGLKGAQDLPAGGLTTLALAAASNMSYSGAINNGTGTLAVTKTGSGTQTLAGTNAYTGATTISAGILLFPKTASLYNGTAASWLPANISVASAATLGVGLGDSASGYFDATALGTLLNATHLGASTATTGLKTGAIVGLDTTNATGGTFTYATVIPNNAGGSVLNLAKLGSGTLILSGANTYTGTTTINAGVLQIGNAGATGNIGTGAITNNGALVFNRTGALAVAGIISGTGLLTQSGSGTTTLSGVNTYTGLTTVTAGTLSIASIKTVNGGNSSVGAVTTAINGTIALGSGTNTGTLQYSGTGDTSNRIIDLAGLTGGGVLDQSGTGLLTLSGGVTASGAGIKTLTLTGTGSGVLSGAIVDNSGTNKTSLSKTGTGIWKLAGTNSYTGTTSVSGGTLQLQSPTTVPAGNTSISVTSGGTVAVNVGGAGQWAQSDIDAIFTAPASFAAGTSLGFDTTGGAFTYNPATLPTALGLLKLGANTLTLSTAATYTGATVINGGTLTTAGGTNPLASTAINFSGSGTLGLGSGTQTLVSLTVASGATAAVTGSGGALTLAGTPTAIGSALVGTSTLDLSALSTFTYNNSAGTFGVQASNVAGANGLLKLADGNSVTAATVTVNSGAGTTAVGNLQLGTTNTIHATTLQVGSNGSGTLNFRSGLTAPTVSIRDVSGGNSAAIAVGISASQGTVSTVDLSAATMDIVASTVMLGQGYRGTLASPVSPAVSGTLALGAGNASFGTVTLGQMTSGTDGYDCTGIVTTNGGTVSIQTLKFGDKVSTATRGMTATFTLGGGTTLSAQTLQAGAQGAGGTQTRVFNWNDGTLKNYDASTNLTINSPVAINLAATGTHAFNIDSGRTGTINAVLADGAPGGTLAKSGAGTLTLNAANTYTGATTLNAGTTLANNITGSATGTATVTVKSTAILGGTGTVSGAVTLESGGVLAPGIGAIGSLATGDLTLPTGASLAAEINSSGTPAWDAVNVTGNVTLGGNLALTDVAGTPAVITLGTKLALVSYSGSLSGTFSGKAEGSTFSVGSNTFKIRYADAGKVTLEAVSANAYDSWALSKGLDGTNNGPTQDPDHDGLNNLLEFYLGGNPLGSSTTEVPVVSTDATYLTLTFKRDDTAEGAVTAQVAEYGSDLTGWTDVAIGATSSGPDVNGVIVTVVENSTAPDDVTVQVPKALSSGGKLFLRLKVTR